MKENNITVKKPQTAAQKWNEVVKSAAILVLTVFGLMLSRFVYPHFFGIENVPEPLEIAGIGICLMLAAIFFWDLGVAIKHREPE